MVKNVCVAGAGTMGRGIAQVSALAGFSTVLYDVNPEMLQRAARNIEDGLDQLSGKGKMTPGEAASVFKKIRFTTDATECVADFFIEAIIEKAAPKIELFNRLAAINSPCAIFATNTSSLSVSAIQEAIIHPERVAGMHFFNPATIMKLVEVVKGRMTNDETLQSITHTCTLMDKTPVHCDDAPGFIVNRVARHYYLEAMKIVESGIAGINEVDELMEASGFKMGPFKLMDLIGMDINLAVSKGLYEAFQQAERFAPSPLQEEKVARGELGRKSGKGFYTYDGSAL